MSLAMILLAVATAFLAFSNGANDNFKGVASFYGGETASYRLAIGWATVTTAAGSFVSIILAEALLRKFTGKGLVDASLVGTVPFLLAVAAGAGITVLHARAKVARATAATADHPAATGPTEGLAEPTSGAAISRPARSSGDGPATSRPGRR